MYKLEFTLRQHTPLIHFQHDQEGATLRATEVKPKLDRFICKTVFNDDFDKVKTYLVGYIESRKDEFKEKFEKQNFRTLNYKLFIHENSINETETYVITNFIKEDDKNAIKQHSKVIDKTAYFADAENIKNGVQNKSFEREDFSRIRKGVDSKTITIEFKTWDKIIMELIDKYLLTFLCLENFGTRQSKGFGCFFPEGTSISDLENVWKAYRNISVYKCDTKKTNYIEALQLIQSTYQLLKSGTNKPRYDKSKLFRYYCDKGIGWEKREIKRRLSGRFPAVWKAIKYETSIHRIQECDEMEDEDYRYIRALLGLAEQIEFLTFKKEDTVRVKIQDRKSKSEDTKEKEKSIQRFPSPITFKVFEGQIYVIAHKLPDELFYYDFKEVKPQQKRVFDFDLESNVGGVNVSNRLVSLTIPVKYDLSEFLDKFLHGFVKLKTTSKP